ncbi:unnamed protein product [Linum trigynum]|uniref:Uncharacterized protein n=1 Tax=Linum trigynum TaxID=586398 RepID=A0AAV2E814_9ROSI
MRSGNDRSQTKSPPWQRDPGSFNKTFEAEISLHALAGVTVMPTMRFAARLLAVDVMVMVFNGSSHNFIDKDLTLALGLKEQEIKPFTASVANGAPQGCSRMFQSVPITLQGHTLAVTLLGLPLKGLDVVLGVQWLWTVGLVTCDWRRMTLNNHDMGGERVFQGLHRQATIGERQEEEPPTEIKEF